VYIDCDTEAPLARTSAAGFASIKKQSGRDNDIVESLDAG